ncbi:hypothetical protein LCGC14_1080900 [marine sediment metagenome]|uniref:Uncharacterized protein n=1 Tax=marine sediment metagenome TaxID=412755 RepID=A0A0F9PYF9_9ZZZZ
MAIKIKSVSKSAAKYVERGSQAGDEFREGVSDTTDQAERAIAAEPAYVAGIQDSIARGARVAGLQKSGTDKWKRKTLAVGPRRLVEGIRAAKSDYADGVSEFFSVIAALDLPPRGPKGSPENFERSRIVGDALHAKKIEG